MSAGNQGWDVEQNKDARYPCVSTLPNVVCVAATDQEDRPASWSNWGAESVDLGAPGVGLLTTHPTQRSLLLDSFHAPLDAKWTTGGAGAAWEVRGGPNEWHPQNHGQALHDSPDGPYPNDADTWIGTAQAFDLRGHRDCALYSSFVYDLAAGDVLRVEATGDGTAWTELGAFTGPTASPSGQSSFRSYDLEALEGGSAVRLRLRLTTDAAGTARGVRVHYLQLFCRTVPYRGNEYTGHDGTSFAAPVVAGAAALVLAARPELTTAQLKAALLDTGEPLPGLAGRTVSGRRLNVRRAMGLPETEPAGGAPASSSGEPVTERPPPGTTTGRAPSLVEQPTLPPPVASDTRAPACRAGLPRRVRPGTLASGRLRVTLRCDEPGRVRAELWVGRATARVLGVRVRAARVRLATGAGTTALRLRAVRRFRPGLRRARAVRAELRVTATDAAGNRSTQRRRLALRR